MGRAFEFRKARKFKRWGNMARVFTKLGKEITIAAKQGGPEPENNPRLRVLMQNAKKENMPKENVERAIKRAVSKDFTDYKEMNYEGYGPFGIAIFVETATDNTTRTVANVRSYFNKNGGSLGTSGFFDSFRSKGKTLILITILIICSASLTAVGLKYLFDIDTPSVVGLIAGALTSTPGLAVAIDSTNSPLASIAYGIAYPFGVIGVILFVKLLPKIMRVDLDQEARRLEIERRGQFPELNTCIFRVSNPSVFNRSLMQINARAMTGAVISRLKHDEEISIPTAHTVLCEGDYIQAVGSEESLDQLSVLVGKREEGELPLDKTQEIESLLLTKKDMINKQLGNLNLQRNFGCTVTRVRRSGIDLSPSPDLALKFGDKLMVVGEKEGIKGVARLLGNDAKKLSDTDFFPIAMGIVLGVLFGKLNISFSDSLSFSPGLTGGVLMVALMLSAVGKTGPILWSMSGPANQLLRQLGLLLFLAEVGTSAGKNLVATFQESGLLLFGVGAAITIVPMLVAVLVGRLAFKINVLDLLGTITGGMTSTPGLAAADSMVDSNIPSVAYATVYPIAMVFLILFIQIIATVVY